MKLGALEAGGTKMVCVLGDENGNIFERVSFPTREPAETMPDMVRFFREKGVEALGVGSFGPLCLNPHAPNYGSITTTPKPGWRDYPLAQTFRQALGVPVEIDTDVNAAALGEALLGAGQGVDTLVYYTVGTGVGGGLYSQGKLHHGLVHPEMGHMILRPHRNDPTPEGFCPYHKGCLEGMAAGPALEKRWGVSARELPPEHIAWKIEAEYLAQMCANAVCCLSPEKIILGGGVMHRTSLFARVRERTGALLGGYIQNERILNGMEDYIVPPALGDLAGATGAALLARRALKA